MIVPKSTKLALLFPLLLLLAGCAALNPLDLSRVDASATPSQVRQDFERYRGRTVQWGGLIVNRSEDDATPRLEILSYPLHDDGSSADYLQPTGLFWFRCTGSTDLAAHQPGRFVTVVGEIGELSPAEGGAKSQPLPQVNGEQIYLWGWRSRDDYRPRAIFGFGLGMHF
jgi:outer membrane lipoprotein